jgi:Zn-dependent protease
MSWKLGRIAGIDVYVHSTFLLLLLLPGALTGAPLLVLVFGCVLLHEFGHALTARRYGIETPDITLYPIGGVARLSKIPKAPQAEFLIALAGPLVNFAIAAILLATVIGSRFVGLPGILSDLIEWLIIINLTLGLFNLIPAFPMDGGRVLRAALSGWLGRTRATMVAATIGRLLAIGFGTFSLVGWLFGIGGESSPSLVHIALAAFIYVAASAEEAHVVAEERSQRFDGVDPKDGIWNAPPGYHWVQRGNGVWQLAPYFPNGYNPNNQASPWR